MPVRRLPQAADDVGIDHRSRQMGREMMRNGVRVLGMAIPLLVATAPFSVALSWEYRTISGCKLFAVRMPNRQVVPVIDDHGHLVPAGSSACAPAGDHVEFTRSTGPTSIHVDGIYPATGRTWHADMRLPPDWATSGRQPQLQSIVRNRG